MNKILLCILLSSACLIACANRIDPKEAEDIAIQAAIDEGYANPRLFTDFDSKTTEKYHYSKLKDKDIKVLRVGLITDERPLEVGLSEDLVYFIDIENGDIVDKISGVD